MDIRAYNREAWNRQVADGNQWTVPVSPEVIAAARRGEWSIGLTDTKPAPRAWFPDSLDGVEILCLASGGGQQGPVLAAAGARVTVFDNSPRQLERDRLVAEREGLAIRTVEGDMRDLSVFPDASFDLIIHPISNLFVDNILPVWQEAYRVLRPGGTLLAAFMNPFVYIFDMDQIDRGVLEQRYSIPYSDLESQTPEARDAYLQRGWPLEWSHTLAEQIGGQVEAGFAITGFYEDAFAKRIDATVMPTFFATRAIKLP